MSHYSDLQRQHILKSRPHKLTSEIIYHSNRKEHKKKEYPLYSV